MGKPLKAVLTAAIVAVAAQPAAADFAGLYIGSHVGGNFADIDVTGDFDNPALQTSYSLEPQDWTAGVQVGYNLPYSGSILGIEAAASFGSARDTLDVIVPDSGLATDDFASFVFKDTITLALRGGIPIQGTYLPFVKVGVVWADIAGQASDTDGVPPVIDDGDLVRLDGWETGVVLGAGIEILWAKNWTVKAEYEYQDFGRKDLFNIDGDDAGFDATNQTIKIGVNYLFGR